MANTTNFGWETPDDTDLVKDGAAAMRTLGNSIDASFVDLKGGTTGQVLAKASNTDLDFVWSADAAGIPATIFDAKGDLIAASAADTAARLAVGTNGQVLTADSTTATGLKWATAGADANWTLVNAGGTALTGAATVTVSGISAKDKLWIFIDAASSANSSAGIGIRLNGDTASNYYPVGIRIAGESSYSNNNISPDPSSAATARDNIQLLQLSGSASSQGFGSLLITGCNTSGVKVFNGVGSALAFGSSGERHFIRQGYYNSSSTITSVSVFSNSGNLDNGTVFVYQSA